jgi:hypothetical protein
LGQPHLGLIHPPVHAQCVDYREFIHWIAKIGINASSWEVAVEGNYAYVAERGYGLQVVDVSEPESPRVVNEAIAQFDSPTGERVLEGLLSVGLIAVES